MSDSLSPYERLSSHSGRHDDIANPHWVNDFVPMLRPYRGLREDAFHDVIKCIYEVADELRGGGGIRRTLVTDLWSICHFARAWDLHQTECSEATV